MTALHEFLCPEVRPETRRLRDDPSLIHSYPRSALMVADFAANHLTHLKVRNQRGLFSAPLDAPNLEDLLAPVTPKPARSVELIAQLRSHGAQWAVANMMDSSPFAPELYFGFDANILKYNRRRSMHSTVLWRLPGYYEPGPALGNSRRPPFEDAQDFLDKAPLVRWRGGANATAWPTPFAPDLLPLPLTQADLIAQAGANPRAAAVLFSLRNPDIADLRFGISRKHWLRLGEAQPEPGIIEKFVPAESLLDARYQLCVPGHDAPSQLYWVIATNSLAMVVESEFEVIPDFFLKPWVHYVPVQRDLSDLRDKLAYCQDNPALCLAIIDRAQAAYRAICDPALWAEAEGAVLDRLGWR